MLRKYITSIFNAISLVLGNAPSKSGFDLGLVRRLYAGYPVPRANAGVKRNQREAIKRRRRQAAKRLGH